MYINKQDLTLFGFSRVDVENAKYISKNAFVDINTNHGEAKDFIDKLSDENKDLLDSNLIFINIDAHSDIHINMRHDDMTLANWINFLLLDYKIESFYWAFPKWLLKNKKISDDANTIDAGPINPLYSDISNGQFLKKVYLNHKDYEIISQEKISRLNKNCDDFGINRFYEQHLLEEFTLNIIDINKLPNLKNKKIFLSIDADFFSNLDIRNENYPQLIKKKLLYNRFSSFLKSLKQKEIQPIIITMTYSPEYIDMRDKKYISDFFNLISSQKK